MKWIVNFGLIPALLAVMLLWHGGGLEEIHLPSVKIVKELHAFIDQQAMDASAHSNSQTEENPDEILFDDQRAIYSCLYTISQLEKGMSQEAALEVINQQEVLFYEYSWIGDDDLLLAFTDHLNLQIEWKEPVEVTLGLTCITDNGIDPLVPVTLPERVDPLHYAPPAHERTMGEANIPSEISFATSFFHVTVRASEADFARLYYACAYLSPDLSLAAYLERLAEYQLAVDDLSRKGDTATVIFSPRYSLRLHLADGLIDGAEIIADFQDVNGQTLCVPISTEVTWYALEIEGIGVEP